MQRLHSFAPSPTSFASKSCIQQFLPVLFKLLSVMLQLRALLFENPKRALRIVHAGIPIHVDHLLPELPLLLVVLEHLLPEHLPLVKRNEGLQSTIRRRILRRPVMSPPREAVGSRCGASVNSRWRSGAEASC